MHRVYLHNLLWEQDSIGFIKRIKAYLKVSEVHKLKTMFVLLDDVWHPQPKLGKQPEPIPFVHKDGTSVYQGVAAVFIAQAFGLDLSLSAQLGIVLTATLASIGTLLMN